MRKRRVVIDIETLRNIFCACWLDVDTKETGQFEISHRKDEFYEFRNFIDGCQTLIGFNIKNFDYPVIYRMFKQGLKNPAMINVEAGVVIDEKWPSVRFPKVALIDPFLINHFDNHAKSSSLKDLQFVMGWKRMQSLPFEHHELVPEDRFDDVIDYCHNDVASTYEFFKMCLPKINLRNKLGQRFGLDLINHNDTSIGSEILLDMLCKQSGMNKAYVRGLRTFRDGINLGEIILNHVEFKTPQMKAVLERMRNTTVRGDSPEFKMRCVIDGFPYDFGVGGLHGAAAPGRYVSTDTHVIRTADVTSYYPRMAVNNKWYPEHLGHHFYEVYSIILETRVIAKKNGDSVTDSGLKLAVNGTFGKTGDADSYLCDVKHMLKTTINGQLQLAMLGEILQLEGFKMLMANTDGLEAIVPKDKEPVFDSICADWEKLTKMTLEHDTYSVLALRDVNNYLAMNLKGKIKRKGALEPNIAGDFHKEYHKDWSHPIIPMAAEAWLIHKIPPAKTIAENRNLMDFAIRVKVKSDAILYYHELGKVNGLPAIVKHKLEKVNRVIVSSEGGTIIRYDKGSMKESKTLGGNKVIVFNDLPESTEEFRSKVNESWYVKETWKLIESIENNQNGLF